MAAPTLRVLRYSNFTEGTWRETGNKSFQGNAIYLQVQCIWLLICRALNLNVRQNEVGLYIIHVVGRIFLKKKKSSEEKKCIRFLSVSWLRAVQLTQHQLGASKWVNLNFLQINVFPTEKMLFLMKPNSLNWL